MVRLKVSLLWLVLLMSGVGTTRADWRPHLHTREVRAVLLEGDTLWVASSGGLERYELPQGTRVAHYTRRHGLDDHDLRSVERRDGSLVVRTLGSLCRLGAGERFVCTPANDRPAPLRTDGHVASLPVTARRDHPRGQIIATAGDGVWWLSTDEGGVARRLTPEGQACTQHPHVLARHGDSLWIAGFRDGLCRLEGDQFLDVGAPFRMVNALLSARGQLWVATSQGLWRSEDDGAHFLRVQGIEQRAVTGLAVRGRHLWATTASALWRIPLYEGGRLGSYWRPGGSRSLQAVAARGRELWLASEDRGLIRFVDGRAQVFDRLQGLPTSWFVHVAVDGRGRVLGASLRDGLVVLEEARGQVTWTGALSQQWLMRVAPAQGGSWIATQSGLQRWPVPAPLPSDLPRASVHGALEHGSSLWIATEAGLIEVPGHVSKLASTVHASSAGR